MDIFSQIETSLQELHQEVHKLSDLSNQLKSRENLSFSVQEKMVLRTEQVRIRHKIETLQKTILHRQQQLKTLAKNDGNR